MKSFHEEIDKFVWDLDISYTEAVIMYGEKYDVDSDTLGEMVKENQIILAEISQEAADLNLIEKTTTFPNEAIEML